MLLWASRRGQGISGSHGRDVDSGMRVEYKARTKYKDKDAVRLRLSGRFCDWELIGRA